MQKPLRGPALSEAIRNYIKEYILEHQLKEGDPLPPEPQLMEELEVGRSSVREAIKGLQSLGIVEIRRGNGLYVREINFDPVVETLTYNMRFDPSMFAEVFQIRVWLEAAVIEDAVRQISDHTIIELEALMKTWEARIYAGEPYADLDEQFHRILYQALNNRTLIKLFEVFWLAFENIGIETIQTADTTQVLKDHWSLLEAVKSRDTALAQERLIYHFSFVQDRIHRAIEVGESA
jgi:DNA-binding FadR family transcriptional regulator